MQTITRLFQTLNAGILIGILIAVLNGGLAYLLGGVLGVFFVLIIVLLGFIFTSIQLFRSYKGNVSLTKVDILLSIISIITFVMLLIIFFN